MWLTDARAVEPLGYVGRGAAGAPDEATAAGAAGAWSYWAIRWRIVEDPPDGLILGAEKGAAEAR